VVLSLLKRASENGFTTLVATLDTMFLGWRPLDLETAYLPFVHGVGSQVGTSDPVFMARYNLKPRVNDHPEFPHDSAKSRELVKSGDAKAKENAFLGKEWIGECNSGVFRTWEDVEFLKDNWSGRLVLKGIQSVAVSPF
jgi:lactate 2-monooxygenase